MASSAFGEADPVRNITPGPVNGVHTPLVDPAKFVQRLAIQSQLLACLKWFGEFQVLACIPLSGSIPVKEVAELAGVPYSHLCRIVRMAATSGFLQEPQPEHVAHTTLSAPFVTDLSFLDAAMFLAKTAAPAALQMSTVTQRYGDLEAPIESAYTVAFNTSQPFNTACAEQPRLRRQWCAYRRYAADLTESCAQLLSRLDWRSLGTVKIVDACAQSTHCAIALAELYPSLQFVVQLTRTLPDGSAASTIADADESIRRRITTQRRLPSSDQSVEDAAVYIIRFPTSSPGLRAQIFTELTAHLRVLRANTSATLIVAPPLLPEPGTVDPEIEAMARLRDLSYLQLSNESELELGTLIDLVNSVQDSRGGLAVIHQLKSRNGAAVSVVVRYRANVDGSDTAKRLLQQR